MPINIQTLSISENYIRKMFNDYFQHVIKTQETLLKFLKNKEKMNQEKYDELFELEKESNTWEAKILDEASWIISKDMPRAAHLRYLIAIIRSIKDLERMSDYVIGIATFLYHHYEDISDKIYDILSSTLNESLNVVKLIANNIKSGDNQNTNFYSKKAIPSQETFSKKYITSLKQLGQIIFKSQKIDKLLGAFVAMKNIERNADHAMNIIESFVYITESNFYFTKESRKYKK